MPITPAQLAAAQLLQHGAAHDPSQQILLIAGPGTGKSFSIGERVHWLLSRGVQPNAIYAVSFTNAATDDLRKGIESYLSRQNITATGLRVSTLHSLALTSLMRARQLPLFPTKPRIVDNWELEHVYDAEHAVVSQCAPTRSRVVRTHYEAICSTKQPPLPYISNPQPPVSNQEDAQFQAFHRGVKGVYSCMLPGEAVRECVDRMNQGILDPVALLGIQHLIVDEYQDLNPVDVEFIDLMAARGTELFVCGDDDQSIYSFRYGSPVGIQGFTTRHGSATSHILTDCFRSTQNVFSSAQALLAAFAAPTRIPKTQVSAYASSAPPEPGVVHRWKFQAGNLEAQAIAESCRSLIGSGVPASEIMILFSNKRDLAREVEGALNTLAIPFNSVKQDLISSTPTGRFVGALLRAVTDPDDYLAVRTMLGMSKGVGAKSCAGIREKTHLNHLNFRQLLTGVAVPSGIFTTRESRSIALVQSYWQQVQGWQGTDSIAMHQTAIGNILLQAFKDQAMKSNWDSIQFPPGMTLGDTLDLFCSRTEEEEQEVLKDVAARLGQVPSIAAQPDKVKCMTLHTSKGLSARVVFIPGLEQELLPGRHRMPYPGQIEEAARLLYVGVTRARAACIVSYSERRWVNGASTVHTPSTFCASLGGPFVPRANGLTNNEVNHVNAVINNL